MKQLALVLLAALLMVGCKKEEPEVITLKVVSQNRVKYIQYTVRHNGSVTGFATPKDSTVTTFSYDLPRNVGDTIDAWFYIVGYAPLTGNIYDNGVEVIKTTTQTNTGGFAHSWARYIVK